MYILGDNPVDKQNSAQYFDFKEPFRIIPCLLQRELILKDQMSGE